MRRYRRYADKRTDHKSTSALAMRGRQWNGYKIGTAWKGVKKIKECGIRCHWDGGGAEYLIGDLTEYRALSLKWAVGRWEYTCSKYTDPMASDSRVTTQKQHPPVTCLSLSNWRRDTSKQLMLCKITTAAPQTATVTPNRWAFEMVTS